MISVVDNNIIWGMSGTTSGAYCQQWTTIRGATCICDAVLNKQNVNYYIFISKLYISLQQNTR